MFNNLQVERLKQRLLTLQLKFLQYCHHHELHQFGFNSITPEEVPLTNAGREEQLQRNIDLQQELTHFQEHLRQLQASLETDKRNLQEQLGN